MPIRPEQRALYPADWAAISTVVKQAAGWRCQCEGECGKVHNGRCRNAHGQRSFDNPGYTIVMTTAHLNHDPSDCRPENLRAMCPGCHLRYDRHHHAETRAATRAARAAR
jgi:hypothetical protein